MKRCLILLVTLFVVTATLLAADPNPFYQQVLVPISAGAPIAGRFGARWGVTLLVRNDADTEVLVTNGDPTCGFDPCSPPLIPAHTTVQLPGTFGFPPTVVLHVPAPLAKDVFFSIRVRNLSDPDDPGTEIPVIREEQFLTTRTELLDIGVNNHSRISLRVYDPRSIDGSRIQVRVFSMSSDDLLAEFILTLAGDTGLEDTDPFPSLSGFAQVLSLAEQFPAIRTTDRIRIELTPEREGQEYWALASITDDVTNHISLVTPQ
jgi:hypothetical protein